MAISDDKRMSCRVCRERRLPLFDGGRVCWGCMTNLSTDDPLYQREVEGHRARQNAAAVPPRPNVTIELTADDAETLATVLDLALHGVYLWQDAITLCERLRGELGEGSGT